MNLHTDWSKTHPLRVRLLAICATAMVACAPALAQEATPEPKPAPAATKPAPQPSKQPWLVNCTGEPTSGKLICVMSQTLLSQQNGQKILSFAIGPDEKSETIGRLNLPHGIDLTKGVVVSIDQGQQETVAIRSADENGSYATMPITEARLIALKKGSIFSVAVQTIKGDRIVFEISLAGFAAAYGKL